MKIITWNVQWFCCLDGVIDVARVVETAKAMADSMCFACRKSR